jgi:hypothetical protein
MSPGRYSTVTSAQREELWRRYKAGETVLGIGRALGQRTSNLYRVQPLAASHPRGVLAPLECSASVSARRSRAASQRVRHFELSPGTFIEPSLRSARK